jgi:hypothetical protein
MRERKRKKKTRKWESAPHSLLGLLLGFRSLDFLHRLATAFQVTGSTSTGFVDYHDNAAFFAFVFGTLLRHAFSPPTVS